MRSISGRFILILSLFVLLFFTTFFITWMSTSKQTDDGILINMAGRQRMLTQRMTKELFLYLLSADKEMYSEHLHTRQVFASSLEALRDGGDIPLDLTMTSFRTIPGSITPDIQSALESGTAKWARYQQDADNIARRYEAGQSIDSDELAALSNLSLSLLTDMNTTVVLMQRENEKKVSSLLVNQLILLVITVVYSIFVVIFIRGNISRPLDQVTRWAGELSMGMMSENFSATTRKDEIDKLQQSFHTLSDMLKERLQILQEIGNGNLTSVIRSNSEGDLITRAMIETRDNLTDLISRVQFASQNSEASTVELANSADILASGATQQASSLEEISSSLNEISKQATDTADSTRNIFTESQQAEQQIRENSNRTNELLSDMLELEKSAAEIQSIAKTIDDISFQINLLALNANVEAVQAGKYGKGFAVVADEVRNLANHSAEAAKNTGNLIDRNNNLTTRVKTSIEHSSDALTAISLSTQQVFSLLDSITESALSQREQISQISASLDQVFNVTQHNTASSEEVSASAAELRSQSAGLGEVVRIFRIRSDTRQEYPAAAEQELLV